MSQVKWPGGSRERHPGKAEIPMRPFRDASARAVEKKKRRRVLMPRRPGGALFPHSPRLPFFPLHTPTTKCTHVRILGGM